jgi:hypothetical protein
MTPRVLFCVAVLSLLGTPFLHSAFVILLALWALRCAHERDKRSQAECDASYHYTLSS